MGTHVIRPSAAPVIDDVTDAPADARPGLLALIREDWVAHGRDWTRPGFRAIAVHRFGVWRMGVRPKLLRAPLSLLYRAMFRRCRNVYGIEVPYSARIGRRVVIEHQHGIVIHGNCRIGDECVIRQGCTLGNKTLDRPFDAPRLGRRVNVGAGAKILGAVTVGDDAAVGANAVVLHDVPAGALAVGIPARNLRPDRPTPAAPPPQPDVPPASEASP
jgi:serine O-acetyltransferase